MEIIKRFPFSGYSETTTISWRWIFSLCCSFSGSSNASDHKELEEKRLISLRENTESQYHTINLEEASEWITETVQPQSSVQVTDKDDDSESSASEGRKKNLDQEDVGTIAAVDFMKTDEASKDDDARSNDSDGGIQRFGIAIVSFKFEGERELLIITVNGIQRLPSKRNGGASTYQISLVIFDESDKKLFRWNSTQFIYNSFKSTQPIEIPDLSAKIILTLALRVRLYGCERKRRNILLAETVIALSHINFKKEQYRFKLEKRETLKHFDDKNIELVDEVDNFAKEISKKATIRVEENIGTESELLVGLGYNPITGRLTVEIVKGNCLKIPFSINEERLPNSFVKITICAGNNQEITRSKTEVHKSQANPLFKEKFIFQVAQFQLAEVTLIVGVYHKKSVRRKELIGWFSIGSNNSSPEELSHWKNMSQSNGEAVFQWHELLQNTKSAQGLPGANIN